MSDNHPDGQEIRTAGSPIFKDKITPLKVTCVPLNYILYIWRTKENKSSAWRQEIVSRVFSGHSVRWTDQETIYLPKRNFATIATWFPWTKTCIPGALCFPGSWVTTKENKMYEIQMKMYTYTFSFTQMMRSIKFSFCAIVFSLYLCSVILILVILVFLNFFWLGCFLNKSDEFVKKLLCVVRGKVKRLRRLLSAWNWQKYTWIYYNLESGRLFPEFALRKCKRLSTLNYDVVKYFQCNFSVNVTKKIFFNHRKLKMNMKHAQFIGHHNRVSVAFSMQSRSSPNYPWHPSLVY